VHCPDGGDFSAQIEKGRLFPPDHLGLAVRKDEPVMIEIARMVEATGRHDSDMAVLPANPACNP